MQSTLNRISCLLVVILLSPQFVMAQRGLTDVPDPDPAKEQASFEVAEGFQVNLFAAEPMIAKPIQMNWDTQGRLWVATSETYPHVKPGQDANDKIIVLEDTDGDGVAERHTVFAEGLLMPTAILPYRDGVYVGASTELLFLQDTDGDGKADRKQIVLSGFGTEDTHHMIHTLRRGPEGSIYFNQSIYTHSHLETPFGVRRLLAGGVWKMNPETIELEVFNRGLINPWGLAFNAWGQSFETDGAGSQGIHYVYPDMVMATAHNAERTVPGLNPGQPKHCGLEILSGDHLPEGWAGRFVTNDFRGNRINSFELSPSGSGYVSVQADNLLTSSYVSFRPIDVLMGPDGAIYVADWYNPIIQHGEVDFRDDRRDHEHGRIWRIAPKTLKQERQTMPAERSNTELLTLLGSDQKWWRDAARAELAAREKAEVLPLAQEWTGRQNSAEQSFLEGLWLLQDLGDVPPQLLEKGLTSSEPRLRAAVVRMACQVLTAQELLPHLAEAIQDENPQVRLEAVHGLRHLGTAPALLLATSAISTSNDMFLDFSLWQTFRETEQVWLPLLESDPEWAKLNADQLLFLARSARSPAIVDTLLAMWKAGRIPATDSGRVFALVIERGQAGAMQMLWNEVRNADGESREQLPRQAILDVLIKSAERRAVVPAAEREALLPLLQQPDREVLERVQLAQLAGLWKVHSAAADLKLFVEDVDQQTELRATALMALARLGGKPQQEYLVEIARGDHLTELQVQAIQALAIRDLKQAAQASVTFLSGSPATGNAEQVLDVFMTRQQGPAILAAALKDAEIPAELAALGVRKANSLSQKSPALIEAFQKAGQLDPINRMLTAEEVQELAAAVMKQGDAQRGEEIYRRSKLQCQNCHAIGGAGGKVGPDLTSIGASAPVDYLIDSLFDPNKKIKEGYHTLQVITVDGLVKVGVPVLQNQEEVHLRNAQGVVEVIPSDDIELSQISPVSLMPGELVNKLPRHELLDLVRFLAALGKTGEQVVAQQRFVRTWEVLDPGDQLQPITDAIRHNGPQQATTDDPLLRWSTAYSHVKGSLAMEPLVTLRNIDGRDLQVARFYLDVITGGKIGLKLNHPAGLSLWVNGEAIPAAEIVTPELTAGRHRVTVISDRGQHGNTPLQIELIEVPESEGQAQLVN